MSTLKVNAFQNTSGQGWYPARSWCTVTQAGTMTLQDSEGVSSISDQSTGRTQVNMSNAQSNAYYCVSTYVATLGGHGNQHQTAINRNYAPTTSNYNLQCLDNTWNADDGWVGAAIFS